MTELTCWCWQLIVAPGTVESLFILTVPVLERVIKFPPPTTTTELQSNATVNWVTVPVLCFSTVLILLCCVCRDILRGLSLVNIQPQLPSILRERRSLTPRRQNCYYIKWVHWKQASHNIHHKIESRVWNFPSGTSCHINLGRKHFSKITFSQVGSIFIVIKRHSNHFTLNGCKMTVHIWGGASNL